VEPSAPGRAIRVTAVIGATPKDSAARVKGVHSNA